MQADVITLDVDTNNDGNTTPKVFNRYDEQQNRTIYVSIGHTPGFRDQFAISRSFPTKVGNFRGVCKSTVKFTKDTDVPGVDANTSLQSTCIIEVGFSIPVGYDAVSLKALRQTVLALLDDDSFMDSLTIKQEI